MPHVVAGMRQHKLWAIPQGRAWTADEWEAAQADRPPQPKEEGDEEDDEQEDTAQKEPNQDATGALKQEPDGVPDVAMADAGQAVAPVAVAVAEAASVEAAASVVDGAVSAMAPPTAVVPPTATPDVADGAAAVAPTGAADGPSGQAGVMVTAQAGDAAGPSAAAGSWAVVAAGGAAGAAARAKALPAHQRLRQARVLEPFRLTFGKSGVHGWGIFALRDIPADTLISEYRGVAVRPSVAELLEKQYRANGRDCYFFKANEEVMVDSTNCGCLSRFTNHCCMPSLYTKVLMDDKGQPHIAFFSKSVLRAGQELTFDYRFREEEGASRVPCQCGAPNCKGFLN